MADSQRRRSWIPRRGKLERVNDHKRISFRAPDIDNLFRANLTEEEIINQLVKMLGGLRGMSPEDWQTGKSRNFSSRSSSPSLSPAHASLDSGKFCKKLDAGRGGSDQSRNESLTTVDGDSSSAGLEDDAVLSPSPSVGAPPWRSWKKLQRLGAGSFGTVYAGVSNNSTYFAAKEVPFNSESVQSVTHLEQKIALLSRFQHENIVQYLGTERTEDTLYIFLELVTMGSLASLYNKHELFAEQIQNYTRQILYGLKYLHDKEIVHRDVKCANILVATNGTAKLADFGMANEISQFEEVKSTKGSAQWMAPEVINPRQRYHLPADIWSLGCTVLEMAIRGPPFGELEWGRVFWKVAHGEAPTIPDDLDEDMKDFIRHCLEVNPSNRPTATELLQHPFVNDQHSPTSSFRAPMGCSLQVITEENSGEARSDNDPESDCERNDEFEASGYVLEETPEPIVYHGGLSSTVSKPRDILKPFYSMRSDVVEIGFSDFHDAFDPGQIIFLCKRDAVLSELHITFLHSDGMALLVGLGLSWSYIVLKDDSPEIHVHEQEEHTWKEWWADCNKEQSSLVVVREKDFVGKVQSGGEDLTSTKELLILDSRSPGCALQGFARSLMNTTKQCSGGDAHTQGTSHEMTGASGSGTALKQSGDLRRDFAALRISEPDGKSKFSDCGTQTDQPEGLTGNDKHLTVIVHLQSLGSNIDTLQTANGNVMDPSDKAYLEEFKINAIMTVRFFHQPADEGDQWDHVKYLEVTIQATYQLDSLLKDVTSDLDVFGWYHDNLTSSFECVDKGSSCLTDNKFVSALVTLDETIATGVGGTEGTSYAMKSGGDVSVGLPHNILKCKVHVGKERQISSSQNQSYQHSTPSQTLVLQGTGFMPLDVCIGQRLKYETTVAIPMPEHLVWRDIGYHMAKRANMLSGMATAIWGHWDLLEMRNFHTYELCITRDLRRRRLLSLQQKTASARKQSKQSHGKIEKQDNVVQTLFRRFLVYHGFTIADYDSKNHEWEMRGGRQMSKGSAEKFLKPGANFSQRSTNAS